MEGIAESGEESEEMEMMFCRRIQELEGEARKLKVRLEARDKENELLRREIAEQDKKIELLRRELSGERACGPHCAMCEFGYKVDNPEFYQDPFGCSLNCRCKDFHSKGVDT